MTPRNPLEEAVLGVAQKLQGLRADKGPKPVPYGMEFLNARERARRLFGVEGTPQARQQAVSQMGQEEMIKLARSYFAGKIKAPNRS